MIQQFLQGHIHQKKLQPEILQDYAVIWRRKDLTSINSNLMQSQKNLFQNFNFISTLTW